MRAGSRVAAAFALMFLAACLQAPSRGAADTARSGDRIAVEEQEFVVIGGIPQWITISGRDRSNPAVLFLHGGPGNPLSPYSSSLYGEWTRDFTVVQWDQRGAGRTFGRNPASEAEQLTVDRMARDGIEVTEYLARRLGQAKIFLVGGSWGSALGVHMVKQRPDLFHAYIGVSQLVSHDDNLNASVRRLRALAADAQDAKTLEALETLGPPPWTNPRSFGALRRLTRAYEARAVDLAPSSWWVPAPDYASPSYEAEYERGEDYSYLQFVGTDGRGMLSSIDLAALGPRFDISVHLVQGDEDLVTVPEVARAWFDTIEAPRKSFVTVPRAGHDPNPALVDTVFRILKSEALHGSAR